jgi:hypothetical protein
MEDKSDGFKELTYGEKELVSFVVDHTDRWRDYRDQNFMDEWLKYERLNMGTWSAQDKQRDSERSRIISPALQQAIETSHAETMEAIFGQGEFFDIKDDIKDENGNPLDVEYLKRQLYEDFAQDKIRKSIDQIGYMAKLYGTGIGEITVSEQEVYKPATRKMSDTEVAYGVEAKDRVCVKLNPVNPKNFLFDPNGTDVNDCMGVAIERNISIHKIMEGIASGKYRKVDIGTQYTDDSLEPTQETTNFQDDKVELLTYYGLVPKEYLDSLKKEEDSDVEDIFSEDVEDYADMVEAIIVIANGSLLLKAEETPYSMKDRPVLSYQDDTVPNRLLGRGIGQKAFNMQMAIDGSMRSHMDSLALTVAPMVAMDATRLPRGAKFEVKPGKAFMTNGAPSEIIFPFNFGTNDGMAMNTSKEFERMLLMATGTLDSQGVTGQGVRDSGDMNMSVAALLKKQKRTLVNFQEDFLIPFIYKATWRYMQFDPERYPSVDVKFIPTASLGIMAREYEQKQLAFMIQTLGADNKITPILMKGVVKNSSLSTREEIVQQLDQMSQPDPKQAQQQEQMLALQSQLLQAQANEAQAKANMNNALAQLDAAKAQLYPEQAKAEMMAALTKNLPNEADLAQQQFENRVKGADLLLKEEEIASNERITKMQMEVKNAEKIKETQNG